METVRRDGQVVRGFALGGTLFGTKVDDLDKLIKNKDVEMAAMGAEVAKSTDPSIQRDWSALSQAYQAARAVGVKVVADSRASSVPEILQPVDPDVPFKAILAVLQPVEHQVTAGSKQDIATRLINAGWKPTYQLPFPYQSDAALDFYRGTQPIADAGKKGLDFFEWVAAHKTALIVGGVALGGVVVLGTLAPYARLLAPRR